MSSLTRFLLLVMSVAIVGVVLTAYGLVSRGLSTRVAPSAVERLAARSMRYLATPRATRTQKNPVLLDKAARRTGLEHFADHCAVCHANDGSGNTDIGRAFYPPAPDMRLPGTQSLSDGELFAIIENGIRLTGMPAWGTGTPEGVRDSWTLVHFIRRLPSLGPEELALMETFNPRTPAQFREEEDVRRFLAGEDATPSPTSQSAHQSH